MTLPEVQTKLSAYRFNPLAFSSEEAQELKDLAKLYELP